VIECHSLVGPSWEVRLGNPPWKDARWKKFPHSVEPSLLG